MKSLLLVAVGLIIMVLSLVLVIDIKIPSKTIEQAILHKPIDITLEN